MSNTLYITSMAPRSGKAVISLGVMEMLSRRIRKIGFFRPIIPEGDPDNNIQLILKRYALDIPYEAMFAYTHDAALDMIARGESNDLIKGIVQTLHDLAEEHDVDIILVTASDKAYSAAQRARREVLDGTDVRDNWRFDNAELVERAMILAETAIKRRLVLFLGSGVSAGAGLPTWDQLLNNLATVAGITEDARQRLRKADARDYATLIERRMAERRVKLREQIAAELAADRYSLQHGLLASLPSGEAVTDRRVAQFKQQIINVIESEDLGFLHQVVGQIENEQDLSAHEIAAAMAFLLQRERPLQMRESRQAAAPRTLKALPSKIFFLSASLSFGALSI